MNDIKCAINLLEALKRETVGKDYLLETAIDALREKQERENRPEPANEPLTPEQLKEISRDMENRRWVWIEVLPAYSHPAHCEIESAYYRAHSDYTDGKAFCCGYPGLGFHFLYTDYGKTWLAYDREPKEGI